MEWYRIDIVDSAILGGKFHELCRQFQQAFISAGAPTEMALFAKRGLLDDDRSVYLSPESAGHVNGLVEAYGGVPCAAPDPDEVTMVYGVPGAKGRLLSMREPSPVRSELLSVSDDAAPIHSFMPRRKAAAGAG